MPRRYSNNELVDVLLLYGECNNSPKAARRRYQELFPDRRTPSLKVFYSALQRARDTGKLQPQYRENGYRIPKRLMDAEEKILDLIEEDPSLSISKIARLTATSNRFVSNTLRENNVQLVAVRKEIETLSLIDHPSRLRYCKWLLKEYEKNCNFSRNIFYTGEVTFGSNGLFKIHDVQKHQFFINVWVGIIGNYLVGPFVLPSCSDEETYLEFLKNDLPLLLEDVPLKLRQDMWFFYEKTSLEHGIRKYLNNNFPNRWIGYGGPVHWPPHSVDLNPLDFFLWRFLNDSVYDSEVTNIEDLQRKIHYNINILQNERYLLRMHQSVLRRAQMCFATGGATFEHLL